MPLTPPDIELEHSVYSLDYYLSALSLDNFFCFVLQAQVTMKVINGLYPGVTTVELDNLAAEICATNATKHPDFAILAARIAVSNLHKETKKVFSGKNHFLEDYCTTKKAFDFSKLMYCKN